MGKKQHPRRSRQTRRALTEVLEEDSSDGDGGMPKQLRYRDHMVTDRDRQTTRVDFFFRITSRGQTITYKSDEVEAEVIGAESRNVQSEQGIQLSQIMLPKSHQNR